MNISSMAEVNFIFSQRFNYNKYQIFEKSVLDDKFFSIKINLNENNKMNVNSEIYQSKFDIFFNEQSNLVATVHNRLNNKLYGELIMNDTFTEGTLSILDSSNLCMEFVVDELLFIPFQIGLLKANGINLHSAAIEYKGKGILFSAPSGTGKTTQAKLWVEHHGANMVNGDRAAITIDKGAATVHGTPWSGSDPVYRNVSCPIQAIVLLEQSMENSIRKLDKSEALLNLLPNLHIPYYSGPLTDLALNVVEQLLDAVPIYKLSCRPDIEATEVLLNQLSLL